MNNNCFLENQTSCDLYNAVKELPIIDYHCHLSPEEIYEDKPFENIGEIWLREDHYKWRLMRAAGIDEYYITGKASWHDKFIKFSEALEFAAGNPLYHWSHMELMQFFGIDIWLKSETAEKTWQKANVYIKETGLSPRKLIKNSKVELLCTTDDITEDLHRHELIKEDETFKTSVIPSFRTDNVLLMLKDGYTDYIKKLSEVSGINITDLVSFKNALKQRLVYFKNRGCRFSDIGIPYFPDEIYDDNKSDFIMKIILSGGKPELKDYLGLVGNIYLYLAKLYRENNIVMQLHLAVTRNSNSELFHKVGADCGVDCVGDALSGIKLIKMFDAVNSNGGMPQTVLYSLNNANASQIASVAGAFPNVRCGAAWWFCDHKRGIEEQINIIAENGCLGTFLGMLTDSRSFLSYARHDYFRRILCNMIGSWVEKGEYDKDSALKLAERISYYNIKNLTEVQK